MLTNGEYGFGESCTCALIHAHFPERRSPPTESEIIQMSESEKNKLLELINE